MNLLLNALEAVGNDGRVRVELCADRHLVRLRVLDNGPGLAQEMAQRLGEAFQTTKPEGVGLGLAVARQVAEAHGGRLEYSRSGDLSCFELSLAATVALPGRNLRRLTTAPSHELSGAARTMSHILIIDDEESICWALRRLFSESGHRVTVASTAEEGLARAQSESPQLVMLDIRLPGIDGLEALNRLRTLAPRDARGDHDRLWQLVDRRGGLVARRLRIPDQTVRSRSGCRRRGPCACTPRRIGRRGSDRTGAAGRRIARPRPGHARSL